MSYSNVGQPCVFILILNWHGWRDTIECLESIQRLDYSNYRIVVIDNGSTDDSLDNIKAWATGDLPVESDHLLHNPSNKPLRWIEYDRAAAEAGGDAVRESEIGSVPPDQFMVLIQTGANLGFAGGNNVGIRYALERGTDYVWLLNNDTVVDEEALAEMIKLAETDERIGMIGSKQLYYDRPKIIHQAGGGRFSFWQAATHMYGWLEEDRGQWDVSFEPDYAGGASLLVKNKLLQETGSMFEAFFMYCEEIEWQIRAKQKGWRLMYCPTSKVWHKESSTSGHKSPFVEYHATRNSIWITKRYSPWTLPVALFFQALRVVRRAAKGNMKRAAAVIKGVWVGIIKTYTDEPPA